MPSDNDEIDDEIDIVGELSYLYDDNHDITRLVRTAGLSPAALELSGKPINVWCGVMVEAQKRGKWKDILEIAVKEFPNRPLLQAAFARENSPSPTPTPTPIPTQPVQPPAVKSEGLEVFFCYVDEDKKMADELLKQLAVLRRNKRITVWNNESLSVGLSREEFVESHLNSAGIILMMFSADFISSPYYDRVVNRALERGKAKEVRVIPVLLKPVGWQQTEFGGLVPLPRSRIAISLASNRDQAYYEVAEGIRQVVEEIRP